MTVRQSIWRGGGEASGRFENKLRTLLTFLRATGQPDYLASKAQHFGLFSICATFVTALFVATTVCWDYAIDPLHAWQAIPWRMAEAAGVALWGLLMWRNVTSRWTRLAAFLAPLWVEGTFIHILGLLDRGNAYGIGGFLYFFIFLPFLTMAQSLRFSVLVLTVVAVFPVIAQPLGLSAHLNMVIYNAYVWMVYVPMVGILLLFEFLNWELYTYRNKMEAMAITDGLTQVANRRHFLTLASRLLSSAGQRGRQPVSLLFLDIDRFKLINDTYGHGTGDEVLKSVAKVVTQEVRDGDLVGRYGGEEFVVLLEGTRAGGATVIAERIRAAVSDRIRLPKQRTEPPQIVSVSIGAATCTSHTGEMDIERLIHQADQALYAAKRTGRNTVVSFNEAHHA